MADAMGLMGMGGAAGAGDAVQSLFDQRVKMAQLAQQDALTRLKYQELAEAARERAQAREDAATTAAQARSDATAQRAQAAKDANDMKMLTGLVPLLSPNQSLDDSTVQALKSSPLTASLTRINAPAAGGQFMNPSQQPDYVPGQQPGAVFTGTAPQLAQQRAQSEKERTDAINEHAKLAQIQQAADNEPLVMLADGTMVPRAQAIGKKGFVKQTPESTVTIQTIDADGRPVTRVVPKSAAIGQDFQKGPGQTVANRLASAKAVQQTGQDIIAELGDPATAAQLGPEMGRYNSLKDFIGNPPPQYAQLAGQIESYALANMGVHGMRSAEGANKIAELLNKRHTPESLKATINGLNAFSQHFIENETGRSAPSQPAAAQPPSGGYVYARDVAGKLHKAPAGTPLPAGWKLER